MWLPHPAITFCIFKLYSLIIKENKMIDIWNRVFSSDVSVMFSAKAIDEYAILRSKAVESSEMVDIDPRLEAIVERMLGKYV